jgi:putative nucleotidyltransferase with HDIG domain
LNHSAGAARAAAYVAATLPVISADLVIAAAWLHDIGHAPQLAVTGFHAVDGATFLRQGDWNDEIVRLVAHHSFSRVSAPYYDADIALEQFAPVDGLIADTLTFADAVAGVDGTGATIDQRIAELRSRDRRSTRLPDDVREDWFGLVASSVSRVQRGLVRSRRSSLIS